MDSFQSNDPPSMVLWGFSTPSSWDKMCDSAKECYTYFFNWGMMTTMKDKKKSHNYAMGEIKKGHYLKGGQWIPI